MKKLKGSALVTVIIVVAVAAVVGVVVYYFGGFGGKGLNGGKGDEEGSGNAETAATPAMATVPETTTETTIVTTEEIEYFEVTVDGNNYIFGSNSYEIDETDNLIEDIKNNDEQLTVKIKDENASLKAYETLIAAFKEDHIKYIEES